MGITYAWDPVVCEQTLEPKFAENGLWGIKFADCEAIAASTRRTFNSWSDNHPKLKFHDIGAECELERRKQGLPPGTRCKRAEIWITTASNATDHADAAGTSIMAPYSWATNFRHTNGQLGLGEVWETTNAVIGFNSEDICWYLDATFCGGFHDFKADLGVEEVGGALTASLPPLSTHQPLLHHPPPTSPITHCLPPTPQRPSLWHRSRTPSHETAPRDTVAAAHPYPDLRVVGHRCV
jgi:hypothetical protein